MGRHLAAIDRAGVTHGLFEESVSGAGCMCPAAAARDLGLGVPDDPGVVHDGGTGFLGEKCPRQQADHIFAGNELAGMVEKETAIEIAIPGDTKIGSTSPNVTRQTKS